MPTLKAYQRSKLGAALRYLQDNPGCTNFEAATAIDSSVRTIENARRMLKAKGKVEGRAVREVANDIEEAILATDSVTDSAADDLKVASALMDAVSDELKIDEDIDDVEDVGPEIMKKVLSRIIRKKTTQSQIKIAAIVAKNKLDYETQDKHDLGPGEPLTKDDAIKRLSMLMEACGAEITHAAITMAFGKGDGDDNDAQAMEYSDTPQADAQTSTP